MSVRVNGDLQGVTLETGDIALGAVELKNATDDTRATVGAAGLQVDSELPAAAAVADGTSDPTAPAVIAFPTVTGSSPTSWDKLRSIAGRADGNTGAGTIAAGLLQFNGTTFDRVRGDTTNGIDVDVTRIAAGTNTIGGVTIATGTSGGASSHKLISAATTNATSVKGSAGQVYAIIASNLNAAARYLKLYDKATAPTVGTDTPTSTILIPPNSSGVVFSIPVGVLFTLGIGFALTTGVADSDTAAVAANDIVINTFYK